MALELSDGVHDVTCVDTEHGRIRAFVVDGDEPILFDCGLPDATDALLDGVAETGVTPDHLVVTHADVDHVGGFDAVVERYGVETYVPEQTDAELAHAPDRRYGEGDEVGSFVAVHTPGHRAHQHSWVSEARGVAVMGDAASGSDQRGLPAGWFHLPPGWFSEDLVLAEESLAKIYGTDEENAREDVKLFFRWLKRELGVGIEESANQSLTREERAENGER